MTKVNDIIVLQGDSHSVSTFTSEPHRAFQATLSLDGEDLTVFAESTFFYLYMAARIQPNGTKAGYYDSDTEAFIVTDIFAGGGGVVTSVPLPDIDTTYVTWIDANRFCISVERPYPHSGMDIVEVDIRTEDSTVVYSYPDGVFNDVFQFRNGRILHTYWTIPGSDTDAVIAAADYPSFDNVETLVPMGDWTYYPVNPVWSPNGKWLMYYTFRSGDPSRLYIAKADGSDPVEILTDADQPDGRFTSAAWSPNSRKIALVLSLWDDLVAGEGTDQVYLCDRDGSNLTRLSHIPDSFDVTFDDLIWSDGLPFSGKGINVGLVSEY